MRCLLFLFLLLIHRGSTAEGQDSSKKKRKRVAIIGGGISGTFVSKYMAEYDVHCEIESLTIFEPYCIQDCNKLAEESSSVEITPTEAVMTSNGGADLGQGSRVANIKLSDNTIVEIGASIVYSGNKLVVDMMKETDLVQGRPFHIGRSKKASEEGQIFPSGLGIYRGQSKGWYSIVRGLVGKVKVFWRYQLDYLKVDREANRMLDAFDGIYKILESTSSDSFLASPTDIWKAVGIYDATLVSFEQYLDSIGVSTKNDFFNQGNFRDELLIAMNICNNNQENTQMNGLSGMVNFVSSKGPLFSIVGGNHQLIKSAFMRAKSIYADKEQCDDNVVSHVATKVSKVIYDQAYGIEIVSFDGETMGFFDVVILATPIQFSDISFWTRKSSVMNEEIIEEIPTYMFMKNPLNPDESFTEKSTNLPKTTSFTRPYVQVITTVVSHATWNHTFFGTDPLLPTKSFLMSLEGREELGISSVSRLTIDGVYKMFSSEPLPMEKLYTMFGPHVKVEYVKTWGGRNGGATPSFAGGSDPSLTMAFLLYDGGQSSNIHENNPAIYYTNTMESTVAAIEISAIGAKAVAKLVAKRLDLKSITDENLGDEL